MNQKKTSTLPSLYKKWHGDEDGEEYQIISLDHPETCRHEFIMRGITAVECTKCGYGLTGLSFKRAEELVRKSRSAENRASAGK